MHKVHRWVAASLVLLFLSSYLPAPAAAAEPSVAFSDVDKLHPSYPYITFLAERKLLAGYPDGRFGPDDPLVRAAAAKLAVLVAGLAPAQDGDPLAFTDVAPDYWGAPFIRTGVANRLLTGFEDQTFRPQVELTRAQLAALAVRATRQSQTRLPDLALSDVQPTDWYYKWALLAVASGMMEAADGQFRPNDTATRADAARAFGQALVFTPASYDFPLAVTVKPERGQVEVATSATAPWVQITEPTAVPTGGRIRTAAASSAAINFPDGSGLVLDDASELVIHKSRGSMLVSGPGVEDLEVELKRGRLFGALTPRLSPSELQAFMAQKTALEAETDRRDSLHQALVQRWVWASDTAPSKMPVGATRLMLFTDPGSLEPGKESADLTVVLVNEAGEPVIADHAVQVQLLSDSGSFSNAAPVIPEGKSAVVVTLTPSAEEPADAKTRVTAVVGETTASLLIPTAKTPWWLIPFTRKSRAKVRMPWSVASVRGSYIAATVSASENAMSVLGGEGNLEAATGDAVALRDNQWARVLRPDKPPAPPSPLSTTEQQLWSAQKDWVEQQVKQIEQAAPKEVRSEVADEHRRIASLVTELPPDTVKPTIQIGSLPATVGTGTLSVTGRATDNVKLSAVTVNGVGASVDAGGNWSATLTLSPGENRVEAVATDGAGNISSASATVTFNPSAPSITLPPPSATPQPKMTLAGRALAPAGIKSVTVAGEPVTAADDGLFVVNVTLQPGRNLVEAVVTDQQGRTASARTEITYAAEKPVLTLSGGERATSSRYSVSGKALGLYARLSSVTINGESVLVDDDGSFSAAITLKPGANTITAMAVDEAGNRTTVTRTVTLDGAAPAIRVSAPRNELITKEQSVTVQGAVTAAVGLKSLQVNGQSLSLAAGPFSAQVPLTTGENRITIEAEDTAGRKVSETRTVYRVATPPTLMVLQPEDGAKAARAEVTVSGKAAAAFGPLAGVSVNGQSVLLGADGSFSLTVPLAAGENTVTVSARDSAGNTASESRKLSYNPAAAQLTLSSPAERLVTRAAQVDVSGSVKGGPVEQVAVNGASVPVGAEGSFSTSVPLRPGRNLISVALPASAGGARSERTVIYADKPPSLALSSPAEGETAQADVRVTGTALTSYGTPAVVRVNSMLTSVDSGGGFSQSVRLQAGENTVTVTATDDAGNVSTTTRKLTYKPSVPLINIISPDGGSTINEASVQVTGQVSSAAGLSSITVNGTAASFDESGSFSATVELQPGPNAITVEATDKNGTAASASISVNRGGLPPTISISSPADGFVSGQQSVVVSGVATAAAGKIVSVTVGGSTASLSPDGSFSGTVTLVEGENSIAVTATDDLKGTATSEVKVTYAPGAPTIELASPTAGNVDKTTITVSGRVKYSTPGVAVSVHGVSVSVATDGWFQTTVDLKSGANTITVAAKDDLERSTTVTVEVTLVGEAPVITLNSIGTVSKPEVTVSGSVKVSSGLRLTALQVNGQPVEADESGNLSTTVTLSTVGENVIEVTATDSAGQTGRTTQTVTWSPDPLTLTISSPSDGTVVKKDSVNVSGSVSGMVGAVKVTVNGVGVAVDSTGSWSATVTLAVGTNTITVAARDEGGREAQASVTVTYDNTKGNSGNTGDTKPGKGNNK